MSFLIDKDLWTTCTLLIFYNPWHFLKVTLRIFDKQMPIVGKIKWISTRMDVYLIILIWQRETNQNEALWSKRIKILVTCTDTWQRISCCMTMMFVFNSVKVKRYGFNDLFHEDQYRIHIYEISINWTILDDSTVRNSNLSFFLLYP